MFTTDTSYEAVFGAVGNSPRPGLRLYRNNVTGTDLQSGSTIRINTTTAKDQLYKFRVKVNNGEMEYQLNDGQWLTSTCDTSYNGNILVFASMVAGAVNGLAKIRLMKYRYTGGLLNQDMIPVRKNQTGYLFDSVSSQLFGNAGTDSFVVGNDVVNP